MPLLASLAAALVMTGIAGLLFWSRRDPERIRPEKDRRSSSRLSARTQWMLVAAIVAGLVIGLLTGWFVAVLILPAAVLGAPYILMRSENSNELRRLEGMAEWTRSLSTMLESAVSLEQALTLSVRSTPEQIRPEVSTLVVRLRSRWSTEQALLAFAADLGDEVGDKIAAVMIMNVRRRGPGLTEALTALADSVMLDVAERREVLAEQSKPATNARLLSIIGSIGAVALLFSGQYVAPYSTPIGQLLLTFWLVAYGLLLWNLNRMAKFEAPPRFLGGEVL